MEAIKSKIAEVLIIVFNKVSHFTGCYKQFRNPPGIEVLPCIHHYLQEADLPDVFF